MRYDKVVVWLGMSTHHMRRLYQYEGDDAVGRRGRNAAIDAVMMVHRPLEMASDAAAAADSADCLRLPSVEGCGQAMTAPFSSLHNARYWKVRKSAV
jgi:hypothetical protein